MSDKKKIYHLSSFDGISIGGGGIKTYLESLLNSQLPSVSNHVITSLTDLDQSHITLLHVHEPALLKQLLGKCPSIYTLHNHSAYCPSGTKYLAAKKTGCDRTMSSWKCTWGHAVDGCGSRRPQNIIQNLQRSQWELDTLKQLNTLVITHSSYVRGQLIKNGLPPEQAVMLRFGISMPKIPTKPLTTQTHQNQRILFAGRIVPDKGLEWLLNALAQTDQQIHLDIAGEGWDRPRMEKLANQLGLNNRVTWHGWCDSQKLDRLYQQCLAPIFPSVWPEPAGLVTLEAYVHHRPIIASSVGGIPEYVRDGETGILVPTNDVNKLVAAITELARNYQKARRMGEQGYNWYLEEFTLDIHIQRLHNIYEKVIADFQAQRFCYV
jgi:glycosyltransferase involved in cell wall biosynthesis